MMIYDDPIISSLERYGEPPWHRRRKEPVCPVCGAECMIVYKADATIVGCDECVTAYDAYDELRGTEY